MIGSIFFNMGVKMLRKQVMEICFDGITMDTAISRAMEYINSQKPCRVVTPNAEFGLMAKKDKDFCALIIASDIVLPDGIGVIYASKIVGNNIAQRVPGVEFAERLCHALENTGKGIYLLGAKPGVAEKAGQKLCEKYPALIISGTHDGYFTDEDAVAQHIAASGASAVFVCLGAPKQEYFIDKYMHKLPPMLMAGLGGSMDVLAGNVKRAPVIFQKLGLEWFYRLCKEPKRIGRMAKLPLYLWYAFVCRLKGGKGHER